ncbi:DUF427 domain-containing protein [Mycobacterium sp. smrl_JER01]|uniref:DUF427 domain-containing protein n=1 Tax=Mycobacterium sp. smrl_JER01 TaxID=3402633 RepID=UPI003ABF8671
MTERPVLEPTAAHPITIVPTGRHVVVTVNGDVVAETDAALTLQEASYPAVQYIPIGDVQGDRLSPSATATYCPFKGDAEYFDITAGGDTIADAIWTYRNPYPAVAQIAGHVAFYADKADVSVAP